MKLMFLTIFNVCIFMVNAQTQILPLETKGQRQEGVYYKDLNNVLTPYIGTWEGKINGKTFKITFEKVKQYNENNKYWVDKLYGKYEMRDDRNNVLYSTYNSQEIKLRSYYFLKNKLNLGFIDSCIVGDIFLTFIDEEKRKIEWEYNPVTQMVVEGKDENCAKINEMPQEKFILIKK